MKSIFSRLQISFLTQLSLSLFYVYFNVHITAEQLTVVIYFHNQFTYTLLSGQSPFLHLLRLISVPHYLGDLSPFRCDLRHRLATPSSPFTFECYSFFADDNHLFLSCLRPHLLFTPSNTSAISFHTRPSPSFERLLGVE